MVGQLNLIACQWIGRLLPSLLAVLVLVLPVKAQGVSRSFRVTTESSQLEVINKVGSITVGVAEGATITVTARQAASSDLNFTQPSQDRVKVEVIGNQAIDLVINVPSRSTLNLLCYKGPIKVKNISGPIQARTTEGDIQIHQVRSPRVEAHSTSGNVSFSGEILPSGSYTLKSFSGRVEAILPASADFKLYASSFRGGMDLGGFQMNFLKQSDKLVEGVLGNGRASIYLWTQEGSINLRRRP
jgi:hypothetical protein